MEGMSSGTIIKTSTATAGPNWPASGSSTVKEEIVAQLAQSSVELATNSKGQVQITVKVYANSIKEAAEIAQTTYDELSAKYTPKGA